MKKLLLYNKIQDFEQECEKIRKLDLHVEQVASISGVLRNHLFREAGEERDMFDIFLINMTELNNDIVEFLHYVGKNKPELPMIVLSESVEKTNLLQTLLKGTACRISETEQVEKVLKEIQE
jgi:CheY-like chemotaxis protein